MEEKNGLLYKEMSPAGDLEKFIKNFWQFDNSNGKEKKFTILPDGYFDLVLFFLKGKVEQVIMYGIYTKEIDVLVPKSATVMGIAFKPIGCEYIINEKIKRLLNGHQVVLKEFWNIHSLLLNNLEDFASHLTRKIKIFGSIDNRKVKAFEIIFKSNGSVKVGELSKIVSWSARQMNRYFNDYLGLSVKAYLNIIRCSASYNDLKNGELSINLDFYDQSHFIKEIKKHTGSNPKELRKNENGRFLQLSNLSGK